MMTGNAARDNHKTRKYKQNLPPNNIMPYSSVSSQTHNIMAALNLN